MIFNINVLIVDEIEDSLPLGVSRYCHPVILLEIIEDIRFLGIRFGSIELLNESHSMYVDNTKVLGYATVDTTICISSM